MKTLQNKRALISVTFVLTIIVLLKTWTLFEEVCNGNMYALALVTTWILIDVAKKPIIKHAHFLELKTPLWLGGNVVASLPAGPGSIPGP